METINNFNQSVDNSNLQPVINKPNNTFKILFFITLAILIGVILICFLLINKKQTVTTNIYNPKTEKITDSPESSISTTEESVVSTVSSNNLIKCYQNDKYFVAFKTDTGTFLIKNKNNKNELNCSYTKATSDFEIDIMAGIYLDLQNQFLMIDNGTGPSGRQLVIYDLVKKQKIYESVYGGYNKDSISVSNNQVVYWEVGKTKPTAENCPRLTEYTNDGFGSIIANKVTLMLNPFEKNTSTESKCFPTQ